MLNKLWSKIKTLIKKTTIYSITDDTDTFPLGIITFFGRQKSVLRFSPYGLDTNPPRNSLAIGWNIGGNESDEVVMAQDVINRMTSLKEGEIAVHNTLTGDYIFMDADGNIEIICNGNLSATVTGNTTITTSGDTTVITSGDTTVDTTGNLSATVGGNTTIDVSGTLNANVSGNTTIQSPTINLTGNVVITGSLTQSGGSASSFSGQVTTPGITIDGVNFGTHVHGGVETGGGTTSGPQ